MKNLGNYWMACAMAALVVFSSCKDEDEEPRVLSRTYNLASVSDPAISGKVTFTKLDAGSTNILIELEGTSAGNTHPAHIHANSASEGGPIAIDLTSVDGATGMSETTVTQENDGTPVTYEGLLNYDGYVNVHLSPTMLSTLIAQGNIGSNEAGVPGPGSGNNNGY
ncbi:MAG TPA: CHRD domain-containing protein [Cyclobacteriaceae bacterium]|nr:CHRD domain-containing protein [Cyclobacteriaceae bacterium]